MLCDETWATVVRILRRIVTSAQHICVRKIIIREKVYIKVNIKATS
jgi:hypothetical protein